ncbi:MAG TPA: hypothetical protein VKA84_06020 [Gemmatimonadaceae bacterium]|nr:hypothetical protein [Gemmatimonadaceae bacterium]
MTVVRRLLGTSCLVALGALGTVACSSAASDPASTDRAARTAKTEVTASAVNGGIEIHNGSSRRIFYMVVNPRFLGDWATCTDASLAGCHSLAPGGSARVPHAEVFGAADNLPDVSVYWWDSNVDASSSDPAKAIREIAVKL